MPFQILQRFESVTTIESRCGNPRSTVDQLRAVVIEGAIHQGEAKWLCYAVFLGCFTNIRISHRLCSIQPTIPTDGPHQDRRSALALPDYAGLRTHIEKRKTGANHANSDLVPDRFRLCRRGIRSGLTEIF